MAGYRPFGIGSKAAKARGERVVIRQGACYSVSEADKPTRKSDNDRQEPAQAPDQRIQPVAQAPRREPESMEQRIRWFITQGRGMNRSDPASCGRRMRELQPQADALRKSLETMPRGGDWFPLSVAATNLRLCVSCASFALESCVRAEASLATLHGKSVTEADAEANREIERLKAERSEKPSSIIESDAVISDSVTERQIEAAVGLVRLQGYRCDSVYAARQMFFENGFVLVCNKARYTYEIRDKGGKPEITVK